MDPKSRQNRQKGCSGGVSKRDLKKGPSPGSGKVRSGSYLLHFSKAKGLKKESLLVQCWDHFGDKIVEIGVQIGIKKNSENIHQNLVMSGSILGTHFE